MGIIRRRKSLSKKTTNHFLNIAFSSESCVWGTPQDLFDELNEEFRFELDVCAGDENHKCERYFTKKDNGLKKDWRGVCWMNPPYGRDETGNWILKAYYSSLAGATVVCLVPARTDTEWFQNVCKNGEVRFIKGRLRFTGKGNRGYGAPFPSMVVIFKPGQEAGKMVYDWR
jgi:phage N-6-adenine-methyltransferase